MTSIRARVRAEMVAEIKDAARRQLAAEGANLSLRAISRELGMVSSALYRYFPSRDDLLTALIIDAYNDLGATVEEREAAIDRGDYGSRWLAVAHAIRDWARANTPEYALIYGSPVPGYRAPQDTVGPAGRPVFVLTAILRDAIAAGALRLPPGEPLSAVVDADLSRLTEAPGFTGVSPVAFARGIGAWTAVFGLLSFELWGQLVGAVEDYDAFFDHQARQLAQVLGLAS